MSEYNDVTPLIFGRPAAEPENAAEADSPDASDAELTPEAAAGDLTEGSGADAGGPDAPDADYASEAAAAEEFDGEDAIGDRFEAEPAPGPADARPLDSGERGLDSGERGLDSGERGLDSGDGALAGGDGALADDAHALGGDDADQADLALDFGSDADAEAGPAESSGEAVRPGIEATATHEEPEPEPSGELELDLGSAAEDRPSTYGHPEVDAVVERLDELDYLETADHIEVYEDAHHRLHETLLAAGNELADGSGSAQPPDTA